MDRYQRYRARHPERVREAQRRWRAANPDYKREYRAANGDRLREQERVRARRTRELFPEKISAWKRAHRDRHIEAARERERKYLREHPEVRREIQIRYKARKRGATGTQHTLAEWREKLELFAHLCAYCGLPKKLERDHNVPLSRGGSDHISNIIPACRMCNLHKSARTSREYLEMQRAG